jgi:hypothetical protein
MKGFFREVRRINWTKTLFGSFKRTAITLALFIPFLIFVASLAYQVYFQQNPAVVYAHKLQTMTKQVNKTIPLPSNESPVVATVTDKSILPKEAFFSYAQNGDKILMYKKNKLAVLFRPSTGQVVTKAVLNFTDVTPTPAPQQAVAGAAIAPPPTVATQVSPTPAKTPDQKSYGTTPYHPQGKILVLPQQ